MPPPFSSDAISRCNLGLADSIIYDVLVEETGSSDGFERGLGRLRLLESGALVSSALAGGVIAAPTTPRLTYFLTIPFALVAIAVLSWLEEPSLHRVDDALPLRSQIRTTYTTIVARGQLRPVIGALVLCALLLQALVEFGPLWMVALAAPAVLYGPQWAGLMSAMGLGGILGGRLSLANTANKLVVVTVMVASSLVLTTSHNVVTVIAAQVVLALLVVAVSTVLTRELHDAVPSSIRAGVSSGAGNDDVGGLRAVFPGVRASLPPRWRPRRRMDDGDHRRGRRCLAAPPRLPRYEGRVTVADSAQP